MAWTHAPQIKSLMFYQLSQPGTSEDAIFKELTYITIYVKG